MAKMTKHDFLHEAIETVSSSIKLSSRELTLLSNACYDAAKWRRDNNMPHAEKYEAMHEKLHSLGVDLDKRIYAYAERLLENAKREKRGAR